MMNENNTAEKNILVLGIGNILLTDEGVGIHAVKALENEMLPAGVDLLDGGTGGFHLLEYLQTYKHVIFIDAILDNKQTPGEVHVLYPKFSNEFPQLLSAHEIGLKDLLDIAGLMNSWPDIQLVTIAVKNFNDFSIELTPEVATSIPEVVNTVKKIIDEIGIGTQMSLTTKNTMEGTGDTKN